MAFHVGQKVVCVDDSDMGWNELLGYAVPMAGQTYTVRDIGPSLGDPSIISIRLEEVKNHEGWTNNHTAFGEPHWRASRFRPIVEKKTETGMAVLREILDRESVNDAIPVVIEIVVK
jgi:hypothetical protein